MINLKKISIIILNYNGEEMLPKCLPSIILAAKRSPLPCEVVVLDNISTDNSAQLIRDRFKEVRLIRASKNNFLFSYNELIPKLDSDIVILLNNDVKVDENFIAPLLKYFDNNNVFAAAPKQLDFDGKNVVRGPQKSWIEFGIFKTGRIYERGQEKDAPRFSLYAFNCAFDRRKFLKLRGLDRLFYPFTWEDVDLCFRAWKRGWATVYEPNSIIYHDESHTLDKECKKLRSRRIITRRNSISFLRKNISDPLILLNYFIFMLPMLLYSIFMDWAYLAAFFEALLFIPKALLRRYKERSFRKLPDKEIFKLINSEKLELTRLKPREGIVTTWYRKGVSYQSRFLAEALSGTNDIYLFAYKGSVKDEKDWGYKKMTYSKNISPEKIMKWIKNEKLDAVFFPDRLEEQKVLDWCNENKIATVMITNYETIKKESVDHYKKYSMLWCPVKCTYDLLSSLGLKNIHFIRWGIDPLIYSPADLKIKEPIRFIHNAGFGGASFRKNTEAVLIAFDKASKQNKNIELILKSQKPLKEYPEIVRKITKENKQVIINDKDVGLNEMIKLYKSCHVSLLPSKFEGIGLPFLESLSMGLPVITVDAPPMNEWIKSDINGYCCKVKSWQERNDKQLLVKEALVDIDDYADQILRFSDPKLIEKMKKNAIEGMKNSKIIFTEEANKLIASLIRSNS